MLVYRNDDTAADACGVLDQLTERVAALHAPTHDEIISLLIDFCEIE
jgi:hypothetical protein